MAKKNRAKKDREVWWNDRKYAWCTIIARLRRVYQLPETTKAGNLALIIQAERLWEWTCKEDILRRRFIEVMDDDRHKYPTKTVTKEAKAAIPAVPLVKDENFYASREWRELRYLALKNTDGRCMCCGAARKDGIQLHVDHIKPRSKYPQLQLTLSNLQVLCQDCNLGKSNWDETDWRDNPTKD